MAEFEFLGPYRVGELLGRGGMGNVYRGEHIKSGDRVAIKVIASSVADEPRFRRRFDKEIKTLKMLRHPGIVRLVGFGEQAGQLFYSMELVEGETLQAIIRREKKVGWQTTVRYAIEICAALKHAHDIGVTHRDIKPANLILSTDGQIKLVDFGIPKIYGDHSDQTSAGSVIGTPDYMAPEQAGGSAITTRTDLYALGSVLYAMLSGRAPFRGKNATAVIQALTREKPVPLDMLDIDAPAELFELIHQLLEKKEQDRPRTALNVANRLKAMQAALANEQTLDGISPVTSVEGLPPKPVDSQGVSRPSSSSKSPREGSHPSPVDPTRQTVNGDLTIAADQKSAEVNKSAEANKLAENNRGNRTSMNIETIVSQPNPADADLRKDADLHKDVPRSEVRRGRGGKLSELDTNRDESSSAQDHATANTHFSTVDESQLGTGIFPTEQDDRKSKFRSIVGIVSMAAMLGVLVMGAWLFYRAVQPPTGDQLYRQSIAGDLSSIERFLRRFPHDDRFDEVNQLKRSRQLKATLKRLTAKTKLGLAEMQPIEETFLAVFQDRETQPAQTAIKLKQWLSVFGEESAASHKGLQHQEMIELAEFMSETLASAEPRSRIDPRVRELMEKIKKTSEFGDKEQEITKLKAIIDTFQEHPWAEPAVQQAKVALEEIQRRRSDDAPSR